MAASSSWSTSGSCFALDKHFALLPRLTLSTSLARSIFSHATVVNICSNHARTAVPLCLRGAGERPQARRSRSTQPFRAVSGGVRPFDWSNPFRFPLLPCFRLVAANASSIALQSKYRLSCLSLRSHLSVDSCGPPHSFPPDPGLRPVCAIGGRGFLTITTWDFQSWANLQCFLAGAALFVFALGRCVS